MLLENEPFPQDVRVQAEAEALVREGHRVTVLAPRAAGQPPREVLDGVRVRRYRLPQGRGGAAGFLLEYAVAHVQLFARSLAPLVAGADVVHLHNPPDTLFAVGLLARALRRRVVFDHHDLFPELVAAKFGSPRLERLAAVAQRASLRTASAVLVTNESQRSLALERTGLEPATVTIVRNGPRRATLATSAQARPIVLEAPRLVFLGALGTEDGVLDLPELLAEPPLARAHLTIVGDGPCRASLEARCAASQDLARRVHFTGAVAHRRVPKLLSEADIGIDPAPCSRFNHRSTMIKIAEYLAAGLPVVAYDLVETRRTADHAALYARCGDAADFAAKVGRLARAPESRAELAERARKRAETLVWEHSEEELIAVYRRLARRQR